MQTNIIETLTTIETPELKLIEPSKAEQIRATFEPMAEMLIEFEDSFEEIITKSEEGITKELTAQAKRLRLDIGRVRIKTEKARKEQKEEYLRAGKAIDGVSNVLKWAIADKENKLKEIENYYEIQEQKRIDALQIERVAELSKYVEDAEESDLSSMDDDVWNIYLAGKKKEYADRIAAEKKAEKERIAKEKAEAEEQLRIRKENERLKAEAEERERLARIEAVKKAKEEAKREMERKVYEAKLRAEREEKERLEREIKAKEEERKAREEAERKAAEDKLQAELNKGDAARIQDLIADLAEIKSKYSFRSAKNKKMFREIKEQIDAIINKLKAGGKNEQLH